MTSDNGAARHRGVLADWNDARGFGFIAPSGGGERVFVHVSDFPRGPRPTAGREITFFWLTVVANCAALAWFVQETPIVLP